MPRRRLPKYAPLGEYLVALTVDAVRLTVPEIEAIITAPLPVSAWSVVFWSNHAHTPQARAWLGVGWRTARHSRRQWVDAVTFVRVAPDSTAAPITSPRPSLLEDVRQWRGGGSPMGEHWLSPSIT